MTFDMAINLLEAILFGAFYYSVSGSGGRRRKLAFGIYVVLHFLLMSYINQFAVMAGYMSVVLDGLGFLSLSISTNDSPEKKLFFSMIPDLLTAVINTYLSIFCSYVFFGELDFMRMIAEHGRSVTLISKLIQAVCFRSAANELKKTVALLSRKEILLSAAMAFLCLTIFNSVEQLLFYREFNGLRLSVAIIALGAMVALFWITVRLAARRNQKIREQQYLNEQMSVQLKGARESLKSSETLYQMKHDIRHLISLLADSGVSDDLTRKYERQVDTIPVPIESKSRIINYTLQAERDRALEKGLQFHYVLNITAEPFLTEDDLIILLMNSLDNAIFHSEDGKEVRVMIRSNSRMFLMKVMNDVSKEQEQRYLEYLKEDHTEKFGIRSTRVVAEKYGGDVMTQCEDGVFSFSAIAHADPDQLVKGM